jgi:4-aminobutyrate aminotransferase-like enzyme
MASLHPTQVQGAVHAMTLGELLPDVRTDIPGPRSKELGARLRQVESRNVTCVHDAGPIFWSEAAGANVRDADGNTYVDLTAGFGVAAAGHASPRVVAAVERQMARLPHALGDVHPSARKVELLERLAAITPGDLGHGILSANGSDAVESALKTAVLATGRPGIIAFHGGYHGLGHGALAVTAGARFRAPFEGQLYGGVGFVPFPAAAPGGATTAATMAAIRARVAEARVGRDPVGAVIVEPIQGRGGVLVPPDDFLPALRALADELELVLILDEVYTGLGRTGRWFACEHQDVVPDLLVMGKSLGGGLPLSAVLGRPAIMEAWPPSEGEAIHTSTFLGNPVACAAALAHLDEIDALGLVERAGRLGLRLAERLERWTRDGRASTHRGLGLMRAVVPAGIDPARAADAALKAGVIVLPEGDALAFTPPLVITGAQLDHALDVLEGVLPAS